MTIKEAQTIQTYRKILSQEITMLLNNLSMLQDFRGLSIKKAVYKNFRATETKIVDVNQAKESQSVVRKNARFS
jgi:hypothetical protein